jgi:hypothetical protein
MSPAHEMPAATPLACQDHAELAGILRSYHRRQLLLHLLGPVISLILHAIVMTAVSVLVVKAGTQPPPVITEWTVTNLPVKEIDPALITEIPDLPNDPSEAVPMITPPEVPGEPDADNSAAENMINEEAPSSAEEFGLESQEVNFKVITSVVQLTGLYAGRTDAGRSAAVRKFNGSGKGQEAVLKALRWLMAQQTPNGSWGGAGGSPAHTGLALLCFLAHGETPLSEEFGLCVQKGMQWLASTMVDKKNVGQRAYGHGIATYALAEAYSMTRIPFLRVAMEVGLDTIIKGQQAGGGFDYDYAKGGRWDLSVGGWQFQALKAGYVAGASNPGLKEAISQALSFCKDTAYKNGRFGYASPGTGGNMTGVGTVAMQLMGMGHVREVQAALETIAKERLDIYEKVKSNPATFGAVASQSLYGWYYDTQAMFNQGDKAWRNWQKVFEDVLIKAQKPDGHWEVTEGAAADPILATTWACLQLEVYYRYLRSSDIGKLGQHKAPSVTGIEDDVNLIIQ